MRGDLCRWGDGRITTIQASAPHPGQNISKDGSKLETTFSEESKIKTAWGKGLNREGEKHENKKTNGFYAHL